MRLLFILILFLSPVALFAEEGTAGVVSDSLLGDYFDLDEVVVTGTRTPKLLKDVPIQTVVITAKQIEKLDATNVQDLLQQEMPGVEFSYAMNQQRHMNFCGFGGQGVLFLVDGERLAGETMDDVDFSRLNMSNVERIEIVKGAASALYGSNAGGGVINIITKSGGDPWSLNVNGRYESHHHHGAQRYGASFGLNGKYLSNTFNFNSTNSDNFDVENGPDPASRVVQTVYGEHTYNFNDQLSWRPLDNLKLTGRLGYYYRTLTREENVPERYRDFNAGLKGSWEISKNDNVILSYSFDQYDKSDYQKLRKLDIRDYSNVQNSFRLLYSHGFSDWGILTLGTDYLHDYLMNQNLDGDTRFQDSYDAFAQFDWTINDRWEVVGALRYDFFSERKDSHLTPKFSARYKAPGNLTFRFGYGMGFRAPTLKERYYSFDMQGIWIVQGNENLTSELSHNFNASAEWTKGCYNLTATGYYNMVDNKIATGAPFYKPGDDRQLYLDYVNLKDYSVYGAELTAQARWNCGIGAKISYAFTKECLPSDKDGKTINNQYIPARPHSLTVRVDWDRQVNKDYGMNIALNGRFLSSSTNVEFVDYYDISRGTVEVKYPAYTLWKLSVSQRFGRAIKLNLAVDNLFNYVPEYYYLNAPLTSGVSFWAGLSIDVEKLFSKK